VAVYVCCRRSNLVKQNSIELVHGSCVHGRVRRDVFTDPFVTQRRDLLLPVSRPAIRIAGLETIRSERRQREAVTRQEPGRGRPKKVISISCFIDWFTNVCIEYRPECMHTMTRYYLVNLACSVLQFPLCRIYARTGPNAVDSCETDIQDDTAQSGAEFAFGSCKVS
jgi:hypothetical protein